MSFNTKEEIFESEGTPTQLKKNGDKRDEATNENIELVHIDIEEAKKRYAGRILNFQNVDFSDSIAKKRQKLYGQNAYVLEVVGRAYDEPETLEQKFTRLTYEINELAGQLQSDASFSTPAMDKESVEALLNELKAIQVAKASGGEMKPNSVAAKPRTTVQGAKTQSDAALTLLEKRLARLEILLGAASAKEDKQPVVDALEDLRFRVEALNPNYLDALESKLNALIAKSDQLDEKQAKSSASGVDMSKVEELLSLMQKWDAACAALPSNVKRIHSLHRLFEQSQYFSDRLSQLTSLKEALEKAAASDRQSITELEMRAREDIASLVQRIQTLEKKLQK